MPIKSRCILMSTPLSIKAAAGEKTHTRRIIPDNWWRCLDPEDKQDRSSAVEMCPYGKPGDLLVVRENYFQLGFWEQTTEPTKGGLHYKWVFVAENEDIRFEPADWKIQFSRDRKDPARPQWYARLGRFMPARYSRLTLQIVGVRIERLQDISETDAKSEGVSGPLSLVDPQYEFQQLWTSINGAASWEQNPWVFVISFRRHNAGA